MMLRILQVLDHSLPQQSGYASRTHAILKALINSGVKVEAITSPKHGNHSADREVIDTVRYWRVPVSRGSALHGIVGQIRTVVRTRSKVGTLCQDWRPDIIHAHSPCLNGLAALGRGIPLVYEMRSSWEDAAVSVGTTHEGSIRYRLSRALETFVVNRADAVVVICEGLKADLISRGVAADKITIVPNALPEDMFSQPDTGRIAAVKERYALNDSKVIGFFGSFFEWEGVDILIKSMPTVLKTVPNARLLIAGGGSQELALHDLVVKLGLEDCVVFAGRVAHDQVSACYAAADVMAYPRVPDRLTDMVTPLKPLEAMAQGVVVVASDVGGHKELVVDGETGILFEANDHEDLAQKLVGVLSHPDEVCDIIAQAMDFVRRERRWSVVVERYLPVYEQFFDGKKV